MLISKIENTRQEVLRKRAELLQNHGDLVIPVTVEQVIAGGLKGAKVLHSAYPDGRHFVDPYDGFHICGVPIDQWVAQGHTFESTLWSLFATTPPTPEEEEWMRQQLETHRLDASVGPHSESLIQIADLFHRPGGVLLTDRDFMETIAAQTSFLSAHSSYSQLIKADRTGELGLAEHLDAILELQGQLGWLAPMTQRRARGLNVPAVQVGQTFSESFATTLGIAPGSEEFRKAVRVLDALFAMMCYHGPGNVSTFASLVGFSGGASPHQAYLSLLGGLAGANHGGAAPIGFQFLLNLRDEHGLDASPEVLREVALSRFEHKQPLWCIGHALLRIREGEESPKGEPRTRGIKALINELFPDDPFYALTERWYDAAVDVVKEKTRAKFTSVNVDGYSGLLELLSQLLPEDLPNFPGAIFAVARNAAQSEIWWQAAAQAKGKAAIMRPSNLRDDEVANLAKPE